MTYSSLSSKWCSSSDWQNLMTVTFDLSTGGNCQTQRFLMFSLPQVVFKSLNNWTSQCNHLSIIYRGCGIFDHKGDRKSHWCSWNHLESFFKNEISTLYPKEFVKGLRIGFFLCSRIIHNTEFERLRSNGSLECSMKLTWYREVSINKSSQVHFSS